MVRAVIIDDNPDDRMFLAELLRSAGVDEISEFSDGRSGADNIVEHGADIVFLDYRLEADLGLAHIGRIRSHQPEAVIYVVSGLNRPGIETALARLKVQFVDKNELGYAEVRRGIFDRIARKSASSGL